MASLAVAGLSVGAKGRHRSSPQRPLRRGTEKGSDVQNVELLIYPVPSPANLYSGEPQGSTVINFKDYAVLADHWLEEGLYPASP